MKGSLERTSILKEEKIEMVVLEISFGKGRKDEITVHFGDDPMELAKVFVSKHSLKNSAVSAICSTLEETIADFAKENERDSQKSVNDTPEIHTNANIMVEDTVGIHILEDYKGQPPVELQADGLPEINLNDNLSEMNGTINGIGIDHAPSLRNIIEVDTDYSIDSTSVQTMRNNLFQEVLKSSNQGFNKFEFELTDFNKSVQLKSEAILRDSADMQGSEIDTLQVVIEKEMEKENEYNSPYERSEGLLKELADYQEYLKMRNMTDQRVDGDEKDYSSNEHNVFIGRLEGLRKLVPKLLYKNGEEICPLPYGLGGPLSSKSSKSSKSSALSNSFPESSRNDKNNDKNIRKSVSLKSVSYDDKDDKNGDNLTPKKSTRPISAKLSDYFRINSYNNLNINDDIRGENRIIQNSIISNDLVLNNELDLNPTDIKVEDEYLLSLIDISAGKELYDSKYTEKDSPDFIKIDEFYNDKVSSTLDEIYADKLSSALEYSPMGTSEMRDNDVIIRRGSLVEQRRLEIELKEKNTIQRETSYEGLSVKKGPASNDRISNDKTFNTSTSSVAKVEDDILADHDIISYASLKDNSLAHDIDLSIHVPDRDWIEGPSDATHSITPESSTKSIRGGYSSISIRGGRREEDNDDDIYKKKDEINSSLIERFSSKDSSSKDGYQGLYTSPSLDHIINPDRIISPRLNPSRIVSPTGSLSPPSPYSLKSNVSTSDCLLEIQSEDSNFKAHLGLLQEPIVDSTNSPRNRQTNFIQKKWNVEKNKGIMEKEGKKNLKKQKRNVSVPIGVTEEERQFYALKVLGGKNETLVPSASILSLEKEFRPESHTIGGYVKSLTPNSKKPVTDRLYDSATRARKQKDKVIVRSKEKGQEEFLASQFHMNKESSKILNHNLTANSQPVCNRLYTEGLRAMERKKLRESELRIEWSCSRCGTFQVRPAGAGVNENNDIDSNSILSVRTSVDVGDVCSNCGFNQSEVSPYSPKINKTFEYNKYSGISGPGFQRLHEVTNNSYDKPTVFDFLYENKQHVVVMDEAKKLNNRDKAVDFTFQPIISEKSQQLIQKKMVESQYKNYNDSIDDTPLVEGPFIPQCWYTGGSEVKSERKDNTERKRDRDKSHFKNPNYGDITSSSYHCTSSFGPPPRVPGPPTPLTRGPPPPDVKDLGQYFQMAISDRLSYNKMPPARTPKKFNNDTHFPEENTPTYSGQRLGHNSTKKIFVTDEDLESLVDRLANEYKNTDKKRAAAIAKSCTVDPLTGHPYFHPQLQSNGTPRSGSIWGKNKEKYRNSTEKNNHKLYLSTAREGKRVQSSIEKKEKHDKDNNGFEIRYKESLLQKNIDFKSYITNNINKNEMNKNVLNKNEFKGGVVKRNSDEVYSEMLKRDEERQERVKQAKRQAELKIDEELGRIQVLAESDRILKESTYRHIRALYDHLLTTDTSETHTKIDQQLGHTYSIASGDDSIPPPPSPLINLSLVDLDTLNTEAASLVSQVRTEKTRLNQQHRDNMSGVNIGVNDSLSSDIDTENIPVIAEDGSMSVTLKEFSMLIERCLKKKGGRPGRGYLFLRDKNTKETIDWVLKRAGENTFSPNTEKVSVHTALNDDCNKPFSTKIESPIKGIESIPIKTKETNKTLNKTSKKLYDPLIKRDDRIENILHSAGQKNEFKKETARNAYLQTVRALHPFKPTLYKTPKNVKAKYFGDSALPPPPPPPEYDSEDFQFSARIKPQPLADDIQIGFELIKHEEWAGEAVGVNDDTKPKHEEERITSFYTHPHSIDTSEHGHSIPNDGDLAILKACNQGYSLNNKKEQKSSLLNDTNIDSPSNLPQKAEINSYDTALNTARNNVDDKKNKNSDYIEKSNKNLENKNVKNDRIYINNYDEDSDNHSNFYTFPGERIALKDQLSNSGNPSDLIQKRSLGDKFHMNASDKEKLHINIPDKIPERLIEEKDSSNSYDVSQIEGHSSGKRPMWDDNKRVVYVDQNVPDALYRPTGLRKARVKNHDTRYDLSNVSSSSYGKQQVFSRRDKYPSSGNNSSRMGEIEVNMGRKGAFIPPPLPSEGNR
mmetsp:Transcript_24065/g.23131  ORF Transcript_24065/g.23131 Transcript_24065/m.23131 type:complete len:2054 (+) Transcript_24065:178-6339(+)